MQRLVQVLRPEAHFESDLIEILLGRVDATWRRLRRCSLQAGGGGAGRAGAAQRDSVPLGVEGTAILPVGVRAFPPSGLLAVGEVGRRPAVELCCCLLHKRRGRGAAGPRSQNQRGSSIDALLHLHSRIGRAGPIVARGGPHSLSPPLPVRLVGGADRASRCSRFVYKLSPAEAMPHTNSLLLRVANQYPVGPRN